MLFTYLRNILSKPLHHLDTFRGPNPQIVKHWYEKIKSALLFYTSDLHLFSPVLQRCSVGIQVPRLMAVFPVWMAQPSPTPLCILVWKAISSAARLHASVWQTARGLAQLQTAQVSFKCAEIWKDIRVMALGPVEYTQKGILLNSVMQREKKSGALSSRCQRKTIIDMHAMAICTSAFNSHS